MTTLSAAPALVLFDVVTLVGIAAALGREALLLRAGRREIDRYLRWWLEDAALTGRA
jgi:hypothetical protein